MKLTRFLSLAIILMVFVVVLSNVVSLPSRAAFEDENILKEEDIPQVDLRMPCEPLESYSGKNKIILQINDVQAYAWSEFSRQMIADANTFNIPVVASVIPEMLDGDEKLVRFLQNNDCRVEIAQQGSRTSQEPEFKGMTADEIKERATEGRSLVQWLFKRPVNSFTPPQNWYTVRMLNALEEAGYTTISYEGWQLTQRGVLSYNFQTQEFNTTEEIVRQCEQAFDRNRTCVVIVYPSTYVEDYSKYVETLIGLTSIEDVEFTTFETIAEESQ